MRRIAVVLLIKTRSSANERSSAYKLRLLEYQANAVRSERHALLRTWKKSESAWGRRTQFENRHQAGTLDSEIVTRAAHSIGKYQRKPGSYLPAKKRLTPQQPRRKILAQIEFLRRRILRENNITQRRTFDRRSLLRKSDTAKTKENQSTTSRETERRSKSRVKIRTRIAIEPARQTSAQNDVNMLQEG